jgi:hypothetical protein
MAVRHHPQSVDSVDKLSTEIVDKWCSSIFQKANVDNSRGKMAGSLSLIGRSGALGKRRYICLIRTYMS